MRITNPVSLIFKGLGLVWRYTFGFLLMKLVIAAVKSDRSWNWMITKIRAANWDEDGIARLENVRASALSGGATVIVPDRKRVEPSGPTQDAVDDEAKTK